MSTLLRVIALAAIIGTPGATRAFEVYVSDAGDFDNPPWQILRFDEAGGNPRTFISDNLGWPQDMVFLEEQGVVLVSNLTTNRINRHDIETGEFIDVFADNADGPTRMKTGPDGLLYVLQWRGDGRVLRYELDGTFVGAFTSVPVIQAIGLDWDAQGRLYVSSFGGRFVRRFGADGSDLGIFAGTNLAGPTNLWFGDGGDLFVVDWSGGAVRRFSAGGAFIDTFISGLTQPEGVARLSDGSVLIGNGGTGSVRRFDVNGDPLGDFVAPGAGGLLQPNAVVVRQAAAFSFDFEHDAEGQWVADDVDRVGNAQGLTLDYMAFGDLLFVAWFTYAADGDANPSDVLDSVGASDNRWLTGQLGIDGNVATGPLFASSGGRFDAPRQDGQETVEVGTLTIEFTECDQAIVTYDIDTGSIAGAFSIVPLEARVNPDHVCPSSVSASE